MLKPIGICILAAGLLGCEAHEAMKATKEMPSRMDRMYEQMERTNSAVDRQKVIIPFEALLKEEFGRELIPIPFDLIPFAREFAKAAGSEELAEVVYVWMKKLNEVAQDVANPTEDQIAAFNHKKLHIFSALQAVCGFIPREKLKTILREQVYQGGRYQDSVLHLLMLRVQFLRDVMLEASLLSEGLTNIGKLEKAVEYADEIEFVARLPFATDVHVAATGFISPMEDVKEILDPAKTGAIWRKVKTKAERLILDNKDWTGVPRENQKLFDERVRRLNMALDLVERRVGGW